MNTNNSINSFRASNLVYVATNGNDSTGNGSLYNPYLTINNALNSITNASSGNRYAIVIQSGQYNETSLAMIPYVSLIGNGYNNTRITVSSNQVTLGSGFSGTSARIGFFNLILTGTTGIQFDVSSLSAGSLVVDIWNSWINGVVNIIGRSGGNDFLQTFLSSYFSAVTLSSLQVTSVSNIYNSSLTLNNAALNGNSVMDSQADFYDSTLTVQSSGTNISSLTIFGSYIASTLTINGSNATVTPDVGTYVTPTILNGGIVSLRSKANGILSNYTPTNYTAFDSSVYGGLKGIDTFLGNGVFPNNVSCGTAGDGFRAKEGTNAKQGIATLALGTVTVSNTSVTANSRIFLTAQDNNTSGSLRISARTAGTGFTITSSSLLDSGVVAYEIFEPA